MVAHPPQRFWPCLCAAGKTAKVERIVATVVQPASEYGQKGMDELHEQTVNLLSFQALPKTIFDTQVAFNMVARYGRFQPLARRVATAHLEALLSLAPGTVEPP